MPTRISRREFAKGVIDQAIRRTLDSFAKKPRVDFEDLIHVIQSRSDLLRPSSHFGRIEPGHVDRLLRGLVALEAHRNDWLRPVENWRAEGRSAIAIFSSLAHHLLADYPVPPILLQAWFLESDWRARQWRRWFRHLGQGGSLRTAGLPIALTRRMAHEFVHAPPSFPIGFALRWSQVRALGGSDGLARTVAATRLGRHFHNDDFWLTVLHFFINHPRLDLARIDSIVEFLHDQKFTEREVIIGEDRQIALDPPQPDLSIKGWSVSSLLKRVDDWRLQARETETKRALIQWDRSAIGEFEGKDQAGRVWTIRELLDSNQLAEEGKAMDHCVADYTSSCARRDTTIWSVAIETADGRERFATVEVNPKTREVVQAQARSNNDPDEPCLAIVKQWANLQGLGLPVSEAQVEVPVIEPASAEVGPLSVLVVDVTFDPVVPSWQYMTV